MIYVHMIYQHQPPPNCSNNQVYLEFSWLSRKSSKSTQSSYCFFNFSIFYLTCFDFSRLSLYICVSISYSCFNLAYISSWLLICSLCAQVFLERSPRVADMMHRIVMKSSQLIDYTTSGVSFILENLLATSSQFSLNTASLRSSTLNIRIS